MEFLNDPLLYFIVPKTIKMSCMMRAKKAISLAAARGVIVAPACNSGVQRLKKRRCGDKYTSKDQGYNIIASENQKNTPGIIWGSIFISYSSPAFFAEPSSCPDTF